MLSQLSVTPVTKFVTSKVWYLWLGGHIEGVWPFNTITGGSRSTTVIVCVQLEWLPASSVAVHVIVVVPLGYVAVNCSPSLRVPVMVGVLSQLSVAVAVPGDTC